MSSAMAIKERISRSHSGCAMQGSAGAHSLSARKLVHRKEKSKVRSLSRIARFTSASREHAFVTTSLLARRVRPRHVGTEFVAVRVAIP